MKNLEDDVKEKDNKKKKKILLLLLLLLLLIGTATYIGINFINHQPKIAKKRQVVSGDFLPKSKDGKKITDKNIASNAQSAVNKSKFQMMINSDINADENGNTDIYILNPSTNVYPINVIVTVNNTTIYTSGGLKPGYEVKNAKLDKNLKHGSYKGTALFKLYDPKTSEFKGQVSAEVNINVK